LIKRTALLLRRLFPNESAKIKLGASSGTAHASASELSLMQKVYAGECEIKP
jgi:hypothetical protein